MDVQELNKTLVAARLRYLEAAYPHTPRGAVCYVKSERGILGVTRGEDYEDVNFPGGKVEPGESYEEAAQRELKEETGCDCRRILPEDLIYARLEGDALCVTYETILTQIPETFVATNEGKPEWYQEKELLGVRCSFRTYNKQVLAWVLHEKPLDARVGLGDDYEGKWLPLVQELTTEQLEYISEGAGSADVAQSLMKVFAKVEVELTVGVEIVAAVMAIESVRILTNPWLSAVAYSATS